MTASKKTLQDLMIGPKTSTDDLMDRLRRAEINRKQAEEWIAVVTKELSRREKLRGFPV